MFFEIVQQDAERNDIRFILCFYMLKLYKDVFLYIFDVISFFFYTETDNIHLRQRHNGW